MRNDGWRRSWRDLAWAAGLAVVMLAGAATAPPGRIQLDLAGYLLLVVAATACLLVYQVCGYPGVIPAVLVLFALYAAVKAGHRRVAGAAVGLILVGGFAGEVAFVGGGQSAPDVFQRWFLLIGWMVVASVAGEVSRLTNREREVMALAARGLANDEIAGHLVISLATAKTHVSRAMTKLREGA